MLQEHYAPSTWEGMLPWQQQKEEEELEDLAEDALESGDMVCLAELPGAFRIYSCRVSMGASSRGHSESREQCWSAISLLWDLHTFRQQEKDSLTKLNERLDSRSLRLLCLHIRLATVRAQRETISYRALLAARQSWETWPHIKSPCGAEQATLWLRNDGKEQKTGPISVTPQQALLQLLVMNHEQERKHLISLLLNGVSQDCDLPKEDCQERAAFTNGCLKNIVDSQTHSQTPGGPHPELQAQRTTEPWPQQQLEKRYLLLLSQLSELQEVEDGEVLSALIDRSAGHGQTLRDKYESQLQTRSYSSRLQSLLSEDPLTSDSPDKSTAQSCSSAQAKSPNSSHGSAEDLPGRGPGTEATGAQTEDETKEENICTGCGEIIEVLPYLEVCVSEEISKSGSTEEESRAATCPQDHENQGSLITLAWGKLSEDSGEQGAGDAVITQDSLETRFQLSDVSCRGELGEFEDRDDVEAALVRCDSTGHPEGPPVDEQHGTFAQRGDISECDLQAYVDTLLSGPAYPLVEPSEIKGHDGDLVSGLTSEARELVEVERLPDSQPGILGGPDLMHTKDHKSILQDKVGCSPAERQTRVRESQEVSEMDREKTMRNLVDVQRKVELRHRRDRERQMLRVQERLSIVQSRKAQEDLLGQRRTDRLMHLTQNLPQEDKYQQKTAVRERLEQLRRERSCVMQSKRDRNTAGFRELLGPEALRGSGTDDGTKAAAAHHCDSFNLF
ncbi:uncharacterized protein [Takifugu rubripes]|uniref:uncharacterized protein n=1 Tax=Takifugu rubripes TaxID=31033 RepID=UPI001145820C|nr:uncharacterized protein LOC115251119 [Takifugu rubripes]